MKKYSINQIEERVLALLDENRTILEERMEYCDPGLSVLPLIRGYVEEVAEQAVRKADASILEGCEHLIDSEFTINYYSDDGDETQPMALVTLPCEFLRMIFLEMEDWGECVVKLLKYGSEEHTLRMSRRDRQRGLRSRPAAALRPGRDADGCRVLEVFGSKRGAKVRRLGWLPIPKIENDEIVLPRVLFGEICSRIAELVIRD